MKIGYDTLETELLGTIGFIVSEQGVEEVCLTQAELEGFLSQHPQVQRDEALCHQVKEQMEAYFEGKRLSFDLPLVIGGTEFRRKVWEALRQIPYGQTRSYGDIARAINQSKAVRAVGGANHANKLPLIIPCHRVTGSKGKLVGFMGDRTDLQALLLNHEHEVLEQQFKK